jgi:hypothetical protein
VASTYSALVISGPSGAAQSMIVGAMNQGGYATSTAAMDMTATPPVFSATLVTTDIGGTKILGLDNCVYLGNSNVVYKLTNADGSCPLTGLAPNPSILLSNFDVGPAVAVQGGLLRFNVTFPHTPSVPVGTPITYTVSGANTLLGTVYEAFGSPSFAYSGRESGTDSVVASAQIGGVTVTSNTIIATWTPGPHSTFLGLNTNFSSGTTGSSTLLSATLTDISADPVVPIVGATIQFSLVGQSCTGVTNANGLATCRVSLSERAADQCPMTATYAGDSQYLQATASELFTTSSNDVIFTNGFEAAAGGCIAQ